MLYNKISRASTPNMAFFLINVENNFLFDQIFQTQTLENEENIFWKFFYAETKCLYYNKYDV